MSEYVVGVDEVGRGSLVGSAIICAFRSQNSLFDKLPFSVSDSKKINKKKREEIYEYFRSNKEFCDLKAQIIALPTRDPLPTSSTPTTYSLIKSRY